MMLMLLLLAAVAQDTASVPRFTAEALGQVDSIASAEFKKDALGSLTIGVVAGPSLVWAKSYGYTDSAHTRAATPQTVYRIASVTKQITAVMLLQLVERKQVQLSDPVEKYFPEIRLVRAPAPASTMPTLVQLATMTSGLARDPADQRKSQSGPPSQWLQILRSALPHTEFANAPGVTYRYSNVGYAILAAALTRAANDDYVSYVRRRILVPLGMTATDFELTPLLRTRLATGVDFDVLYKDTLNYGDAALDNQNGLGIGLGSGGAYSTVGDVAKLVSLQLGFGPDSVVTRQTLSLRDQIPVAGNMTLDYGYGLGVQVWRWADTVATGHSGNLAGYTSMVVYDRQRGFGVIVLRSAAGGEGDAGRLGVRAFRKLLSMLSP